MAASDISLPRAVLSGVILEAILYGIYVVFFGIAMFLLMTKRCKTKVTIALILVNLFMFAICTSYEGVMINYSMTEFLDKDAGGSGRNTLNRPGDPSVCTVIILEVINSIVGDAIVVWRTWALWERSRKAVAIPAFFWLTSIATGIGCSVTFGTVTPAATGILSDMQIEPWDAAFLGATFMTNCAAVVVIAYRYLLYRRDVSAVLGRQSTCKTSGIFIVIIESGVLYCVTQIITLLLYVNGSRGMNVMTEALSPLAGIYPTLIIILVCLKITNKDDVEKSHWTLHNTALTSNALSNNQSHSTYETHSIRIAINQSQIRDGSLSTYNGESGLEKGTPELQAENV